MYENAMKMSAMYQAKEELEREIRNEQRKATKYGFQFIREEGRPVTTKELADVTGIPATVWVSLIKHRKWDYVNDSTRYYTISNIPHVSYYKRCDENGNPISNNRIYQKTSRYMACEYKR